MRLTDTVKAYRPSRFGMPGDSSEPGEPTDEAVRARRLSIELYARMVQAGRVLFEDAPRRPAGIDEEEMELGLL